MRTPDGRSRNESSPRTPRTPEVRVKFCPKPQNKDSFDRKQWIQKSKRAGFNFEVQSQSGIDVWPSKEGYARNTNIGNKRGCLRITKKTKFV
eukprot:UN31977